MPLSVELLILKSVTLLLFWNLIIKLPPEKYILPYSVLVWGFSNSDIKLLILRLYIVNFIWMTKYPFFPCAVHCPRMNNFIKHHIIRSISWIVLLLLYNILFPLLHVYVIIFFISNTSEYFYWLTLNTLWIVFNDNAVAHLINVNSESRIYLSMFLSQIKFKYTVLL